MNARLRSNILFFIFTSVSLSMACAAQTETVKVDGGLIEGFRSDSGIRIFLGIPYAAPPVGDLRWRPPQPVIGWDGIRSAREFGHRPMQESVYSDMIFRDTMSEDCLTLNVWTPAKSPTERLPVMVWIFGGGFIAGSTSEPRQDGENLAKKGVVIVSMNYRLGIFGFLVHPDLVAESHNRAAGNYGLLDQIEALRWVKKNIAAFGGDSANVTIFGESAGSLSVCCLIASPLTHGLFQRAIGESGAYFGRKPLPLEDAEKIGLAIAAKLDAPSIDELRGKPAEEILGVTPKEWPGISVAVDGYVLPQRPDSIYAEGRQNWVSLLAGWNADEGKMSVLLGPNVPTAKSFAEKATELFGADAKRFLELYPAATDSEALRSAIDFEGDKFMGYDTWRWLEMHRLTAKPTVYRYSFDQTPLAAPDATYGGLPAERFGARHAGEIEYVFGTFPLEGIAWRDEDKKLSDLIGSYWTNFAKTGNPNGTGLPVWPLYEPRGGFIVQHFIDGTSRWQSDPRRARYQFLDSHPGWQKD